MDTTHDAHVFGHRRARHRAALRSRQADDLARYLVVTIVLLLLIRPVGVIVALVWGLGLVRRYYRGELAPRLHRRFVREELRRSGHGACAGGAGSRSRPARPAALAEEMGDDPRGRRALDWARNALDELADAERAVRPEVRGRIRVADLVEEVVDGFEARAERDGICFRLELDADGELESDELRLKAVLLDLVNESVRALRASQRGPARITVQMGESLAGDEVWVRIRDDRPDAAGGVRGSYGSRPVAGLSGATLETHASPRHGVERILTLRKSAVPARREPGDDAA